MGFVGCTSLHTRMQNSYHLGAVCDFSLILLHAKINHESTVNSVLSPFLFSFPLSSSCLVGIRTRSVAAEMEYHTRRLQRPRLG